MLWQCFYQPSPQSLHQSLREPKEIVRRKLAPERSRIPVMKRKHLKTQGQRPREGAQGKSRARTEAHEQRGAASGCSWDIGRARWAEFVPYKPRKSTFRGRNNTGYAQSTWGLKTVPQILLETSQRQLSSRVWHEEQGLSFIPSRRHLMNVCAEGASPVDREWEVTGCVNFLEKRKRDTSRQTEGLP